MGLFSKSRLTQLHEAKDAAYRPWHNATLATGRIRKWHQGDLAKIVAAVAVLTAAEAEPGDPETGDLRDLSAERATVAELESKAARRARDLQAAIEKEAELAILKDKAAVELQEGLFDAEILEPFGKALLNLYELNKKLAEAQVKLPSPRRLTFNG